MLNLLELYCVRTHAVCWFLLTSLYIIMMNTNNLRIGTFNCAGAKSKLPILLEMSKNVDLLFLQETWLLENELNMLNDVNPDFSSFSLSSVNLQDSLLVGRPYGGISILWRKELSPICQLLQFDDNRLLGILISVNSMDLLFINVYLPYFCNENYPDYLMCLGNISSILDNNNVNGIMIIGDFNAAIGGEFYSELECLCNEKALTISDVALLPSDSYTHVNNATLSRSWLDHCVTSPLLHSCINSIYISYEYYASDHFPLFVDLKLDNLPRMVNSQEPRPNKIDWNFECEELRNLFYISLSAKLTSCRSLAFNCNGACCNPEHLQDLDELWRYFIDSVKEVGQQIFGNTKVRKNGIPGWNLHVRDLYAASRDCFRAWRECGSPRHGPVASEMRRARAVFKHALRKCKAEEAKMRAESLALKLQNRDINSFWREVKSLSSRNTALPQRVDNAVGEQEIADLWKAKFSYVLNSIDDSSAELKLKSDLDNQAPSNDIKAFNVRELQNLARSLPTNKAVGLDDVPNEFYKYAPINVLILISLFFNSFLVHSFIPEVLLNVLVIPLLKSNLKDPSSSVNYRPIAIATAASKLFEMLLLDLMSKYLYTSDNQYGFKQNHSTDLCIMTLKEIVRYYRSLNSPIFICFLDIKSAFDRVSYWKLFSKLCDRGVPLYIIRILIFWYTNQQLCVGWGSSRSSTFGMSNGLRQGSLISPYLFNVYVDQLNISLNNSGIGCHIAGKISNNFAYADDLAIICPCASALNELLSVCDGFARDHYITFSTSKSVCMCVTPRGLRLNTLPSVYLSEVKLSYVDSFTYLGHIITSEFNDDEDIKRETRSLCVRGNVIIRKFQHCNTDVKISLFKSFCYSMYSIALWSKFNVATLSRLRVTYNNIMRRLTKLPPWHSASEMFVSLNVKSFQEVRRNLCYKTMVRVNNSENCYISSLLASDAKLTSCLWQHWQNILYSNSQ